MKAKALLRRPFLCLLAFYYDYCSSTSFALAIEHSPQTSSHPGNVVSATSASSSSCLCWVESASSYGGTERNCDWGWGGRDVKSGIRRWSYFSWCICFNFLFDISSSYSCSSPSAPIHSAVLPSDRGWAHNKPLCKYPALALALMIGIGAHKPIIMKMCKARVEGELHFLRTRRLDSRAGHDLKVPPAEQESGE